MTNEEVIEVVNRIKYKPNWAIQAYVNPSITFSVIMSVRLHTSNSRSKFLEEQIVVIINYRLKSMDYECEEELIRDVFEKIIRMERHEAQEWFRVDNKIYYDPHKRNKLGNDLSRPESTGKRSS